MYVDVGVGQWVDCLTLAEGYLRDALRNGHPCKGLVTSSKMKRRL